MPNKPNRLINEASPYLLEHAHNPVDWHPWGNEALQLAEQQERPIFLSIGYSACHWCHVMARESFENEEIAELMNRYFVNVKVDREERPDLDQIYMNAVTALSGRGGWPMSTFLTPEGKPFFGGTYWPPQQRMGMPGFSDILLKVHEAWQNRRDEVLKGADELTSVVIKLGLPHAEPSQLSEQLLENATRALLRAADQTHGGFGGAPKFPHPMDIRVLLRSWKRFNNSDALDTVKQTLDKMAQGGIYDHLGGGFHRYSTDEKWLVPHFEKMLYDNALLASAYLDAFQATHHQHYALIVRETLDYVLDEMTQPDGGFYSTQDADTDGVEGKFFVWADEEITELLGPDDARVFKQCYNVTPQGNWEGQNILNRNQTNLQASQSLDIDEAELSNILERSKQILFAARLKRTIPHRDDKILTSWNGLMIAAMAQAAQVLSKPEYERAARQAADFLLSHLRTDDGRLLHSYKDHRARLPAYLDDYACLIDGLVEVYQASFEPRYLEAALELAEIMKADFHDPHSHGFFYTANHHETLIARNKDIQDNATPSGNSAAALALLRLGRLTGRTDLEEQAAKTLEMLFGHLAQSPMAAGHAFIALDFHLGPTHEFAIVDGPKSDETADILRILHSRFLPNKVFLHKKHNTTDDTLSPSVQPLLQNKPSSGNAPSIYICEHGTCHAPVIAAKGLETFLAAEDENR